LSHSRTRRLSLFAAVERLLQMFPAWKHFFSPNLICNNFGEVIWKWVRRSMYVALTFHNVSVPYKYSGNWKGKKFSIGGFDCISQFDKCCNTESQKGPLLENPRDLTKMEKDGLEKEADLSVKEACSAYKVCFRYLLK
jgi:hypothetical protein